MDTPLTNEALIESLICVMREDKEQRHHTATIAQDAYDKAARAENRIDTLETQTKALLGDGTGSNGKLAAMTAMQIQAQADMAEVKTAVGAIKDSLAKLEVIGGKGQDAMSGGKALMVALGLMSTLLTVVGGIVATVAWFIRH